MNSVHLGDQYTGLGGQTLELNFNINYFTMHLIIAKWVDKKNRDRRGKNKTKRGWSKRRNCLLKCFYSFKCVIDHAHVCFFFYASNFHYIALFDSFCTFCLISAQIPWHFSQIYIHLYILFRWIHKLLKNLP